VGDVVLSNRILVIYDRTETRLLGKSWALYAATFPGSRGVSSWDEAADVIVIQAAGEDRDMQLWGHGREGRALIGTKKADPSWPFWSRLNSVWFRSCSVANRDRGYDFMAAMAEQTNVAAHLGIIGLWGMQSRLVGVLSDAIDPRESSAPWRPRTVSALRRTLPAWAYAG
jgi:hypothetical protein